MRCGCATASGADRIYPWRRQEARRTGFGEDLDGIEDRFGRRRLQREKVVRPDMRYCFRSGRFRPNPRTKHISIPPRHMTKSYIPDFNMISQHYRYKDTTSHTIDIQVHEYITSAEDTCLSTDYNQCLVAKVQRTEPTFTWVQALRRGPLASRRRVFAKASTRRIVELH